MTDSGSAETLVDAEQGSVTSKTTGGKERKASSSEPKVLRLRGGAVFGASITENGRQDSVSCKCCTIL